MIRPLKKLNEGIFSELDIEFKGNKFKSKDDWIRAFRQYCQMSHKKFEITWWGEWEYYLVTGIEKGTLVGCLESFKKRMPLKVPLYVWSQSRSQFGLKFE